MDEINKIVVLKRASGEMGLMGKRRPWKVTFGMHGAQRKKATEHVEDKSNMIVVIVQD